MNKMYIASTMAINNSESPYYGKNGHIRFAREIGVALYGFDDRSMEEILKSSYSVIYVRATNLKPILDAKEWIKYIKDGYNEFAK